MAGNNAICRMDSLKPSDFHSEIDLGREVNDGGAEMLRAPKGGKKRKVYPVLYIENVEGLPMLPKEGCAMVKFRRTRMSVEENGNGDESGGVTLEIRRLCLSDDMEDSEDLEGAMKKAFKSETDDEDED